MTTIPPSLGMLQTARASSSLRFDFGSVAQGRLLFSDLAAQISRNSVAVTALAKRRRRPLRAGPTAQAAAATVIRHSGAGPMTPRPELPRSRRLHASQDATRPDPAEPPAALGFHRFPGNSSRSRCSCRYNPSRSRTTQAARQLESPARSARNRLPGSGTAGTLRLLLLCGEPSPGRTLQQAAVAYVVAGTSKSGPAGPGPVEPPIPNRPGAVQGRAGAASRPP